MRIGRLASTIALGLLLASCGAGSAPSPTGEVSGETSTATPEETSSPAPTEVGDPETALDWSDTYAATSDFSTVFAQVCAGSPLAGYAAYAGETHPLAMQSESGWNYETDLLLSPPSWSEPSRLGDFQLVACTASQSAPAASCGTYRGSEGTTGEMLRTEETVKVRIVAVSTGREVGQATFTDLPECPGSVTVAGGPPWTKEGAVGIEKMLPFLTEYATGAAR